METTVDSQFGGTGGSITAGCTGATGGVGTDVTGGVNGSTGI